MGHRTNHRNRTSGSSWDILLRSTAVSPYLAYALADAFTLPQYWASGTQYGNPEGAEVLPADVATNVAQWVGTDISLVGGKVTFTKPVADYSVSTVNTGTIRPGAQWRIRGSITVSDRARISVASATTLAGAIWWSEITVPGTYDIDTTVIGTVQDNFRISVQLYAGFAWAGTGATVTINSLSAKAVGISALPGYSYTGSGARGFVDASGAVQFFATGVAPINSAGYHAYGALTNYQVQSQDYSTTWATVNATVTANTTVAPDGSTTADTLNLGTASASHWVSQTAPAAVPAGSVTLGHIIKAGTGRYVQLVCDQIPGGSNFCNFDLVAGTVGSSSGGTGYIVALANGFYRCVFIGTSGGGGGITYIIGILASTSARGESWTPTSETYFLWNADLLAGNFPNGGPIITTTTAAVAIGESLFKRNAKADGTALADADMLIFATGTPQGSLVNQWLFEVNESAASNNRVFLNINASGLAKAEVAVAGVGVYSQTSAGAVTRGQKLSIVLRRLSGNWRGGMIVSGVITWFDAGSAGAFPTGMATVTEGNHIAGTVPLQGTQQGGFIKAGTFNTDALVLAAVAETA